MALNGLRDMIPTFDLSSFTSKDTVPYKANMFWRVTFLVKLFRIWKSILTRLSGRKQFLSVCERLMLKISYFLLAIPIDGLGQHMSLVEYRTILRYRLMIPLFPIDEVCPVCRKACLNQFGELAVHCREFPGFKYRHDFVRDILCNIFQRAGVSVKKEAPVNFLTDPQE
jgi:hypothetical protein